MDRAVGLVTEAIDSGERITIYGDYDCDGVCATAILVGAIRALGGECDWFIPDRIADGYGLNPEAIRRIGERGTSLVVTVDCGVTSVAEVKLAKELGMKVVVTDHHQVGPELPDCPILHPQVSGYPYTSLCGAAVAAKLALALRKSTGFNGAADESDLDLVALATVADIMPLTGENRHLVSAGVKVARRARRVGLAALMAEARVEPSRLKSDDFGFRLGPRINAAGRLYRADAGVELFLAEDRERANEIARELASVNAERRRVEQEVEALAKAELRSLGSPGAAVVVAGEGWHQGVVGIVAAKLVKASGRPAVVISIDGDTGRGSARSVPGLDLHAALEDTAYLLESFGGHAAAAGITIRTDRIDRFRESLGRAVEARIGSEPAEPVVEFDTVVGGSDLGLDLAEEMEKLQPFGNGNPPVRVVVPGAQIENETAMGEGKHCRFTIRSGSYRAKGVCFGKPSLGLKENARVDLVAELGINHWNGSIEPQLRVTEVAVMTDAVPLPECESDEWWDRLDAAMTATTESAHGAEEADLRLASGPRGLPGAALAELISSGERIAVLTADASQRWRGLGGAGLGRFFPEPRESAVIGIWAGSPVSCLEDVEDARVMVTDFVTLAGPRPPVLDSFDRIALLDPPYLGGAMVRIAAARLPIHLLAGPVEFEFTSKVAGHQLDLTFQLRNLFRDLREAATADGGQVGAEELRTVLSKDGSASRSPEQAAVLLRVLLETGLARSEGSGGARRAGVVSSEKTDLSVSAVFTEHFELHREHVQLLNRFDRQTQSQ